MEFRPVADRVTVDLAIGWRPDRITPAAELVLSYLRRHFGDELESEGSSE